MNQEDPTVRLESPGFSRGSRRADGPHTLYRFFDSKGALLYIGITVCTPTRWSNHGWDKPWWPEVADVRVEHYPSRSTALAAERKAILDEQPFHNVIHKHKRISSLHDRPTRIRRNRRPDIAPITRIGAVVHLPAALHADAYALYLLDQIRGPDSDLDQIEALAHEQERQRAQLGMCGRFEIVATETAIRRIECPHEVMLDQVTKLLSMTFGPREARLKIIPANVRMPEIPRCSFTLHGDQEVSVEEFVDVPPRRSDEQADRYVKAFDQLKKRAVCDAQAHDLMGQISYDLLNSSR